MPTERLLEILDKAKKEREAGKQINIAIMKKNKKFQKELLMAEGYEVFEEFYATEFKN